MPRPKAKSRFNREPITTPLATVVSVVEPPMDDEPTNEEIKKEMSVERCAEDVVANAPEKKEAFTRDYDPEYESLANKEAMDLGLKGAVRVYYTIGRCEWLEEVGTERHPR